MKREEAERQIPGHQEGYEARVEAHRESKERNFNEEEIGGRQHLNLDPLHGRDGSNLWTNSDHWQAQRSLQKNSAVDGAVGWLGG